MIDIRNLAIHQFMHTTTPLGVKPDVLRKAMHPDEPAGGIFEQLAQNLLAACNTDPAPESALAAAGSVPIEKLSMVENTQTEEADEINEIDEINKILSGYPEYKLRISSLDDSPKSLEDLKNARSIFHGDLHASIRKGIAQLLQDGCINISQDVLGRFLFENDYLECLLEQALAHLAKNKPFPNGLIEAIDRQVKLVIESISEKITWTGGDRSVIFLGDVLADRSGYDLITRIILKEIIDRAKEAGGKFILLTGNHDIDVATMCIKKHQRASSFLESQIRGLPVTFNDNKVFLEENADLFYYDKSVGVFASHIPIGRAALNRFLAELRSAKVPGIEAIQSAGVEAFDADELEHFVTLSNREHKRYIESLTLHEGEYVNSEHFLNLPLAGDREASLHYEIFWKRSSDYVEKDGLLPEFPFNKAGLKALTHGHDHTTNTTNTYRETPEGVRIINLDNFTSKAPNYERSRQEENPLFMIDN